MSAFLAVSAGVIGMFWLRRPSRVFKQTERSRVQRVHIARGVGSSLIGLVRPGLATEEVMAQSIGMFALALIPIWFLTSFPVALLVAFGVASMPIVVLRRERQRRTNALTRELVNVVDTLELSVAGGASAMSALEAVVVNNDGPVTQVIATALNDMRAGLTMREALLRAQKKTGDVISPLVRALLDAQLLGTPLREGLVALRDEIENRTRIAAEIRARRVPTLMLFPLVFCVMPAFVLFTIVPIVVSQLSQLHGLFR